MLIAHSADKIQAELDCLRFHAGTRRCVSLITTQSELHDGHGAVINAAKTVSDVVVVAIMPDPLVDSDNVVSANEFHDIGFVERHNANVLFAPHDDTFAGTDSDTRLTVTTPFPEFQLPEQLLLSHLQILNTIQPDIMVWGERKFIEYATVKKLVNDLGLRTQMQCIPTVRHADGVAVSSNDELFSDADRSKLVVVFETLRNAAHAIRAGASNYSKVENTAKLALKGAGFDVKYFLILDEPTLAAASATTTSFRIVTEATLHGVPVIDSLGLTP